MTNELGHGLGGGTSTFHNSIPFIPSFAPKYSTLFIAVRSIGYELL
jgi:hypothetical protein